MRATHHISDSNGVVVQRLRRRHPAAGVLRTPVRYHQELLRARRRSLRVPTACWSFSAFTRTAPRAGSCALPYVTMRDYSEPGGEVFECRHCMCTCGLNTNKEVYDVATVLMVDID